MLKGDEFEQFVDDMRFHLPQSVPYETLFESVRCLAGSRLTAQTLDDTCWRIAGNVKRLRQRRPVPPWNRQPFLELVPAQITRVRLVRGGRAGRELGHEMTFRILAGTSCPRFAYKWWSRRRASYLATFRDEHGNGFGFTRRRGERSAPAKWPYRSALEFYGLRCVLLIDPTLCDDEPHFNELRFNSAGTTHNREVHQRRARLDPGYECPHDFDRDECPCYRCPMGQDNCPAAVHSKTFVFRDCTRCKKEAPHDPVDLVHDYCVACVEHEIIHPPKDA